MKEMKVAIPFDESFPPPVRWFEVFGYEVGEIFPDGIQMSIGGFDDE